MALQKQIVTLSNNGSLDTKTDEFQVAPSDFLALQNVRVDVLGAFQKRNGYTSQTSLDVNGSSIGNVKNVMSYQDTPIAYNGSNVYSYVNASQKWKSVGYSTLSSTEKNQVINQGSHIDMVTANSIGNFHAYCVTQTYNTSSGTVTERKIIIKDGDTEIASKVILHDRYVFTWGTKFYFISRQVWDLSGTCEAVYETFDTALIGTTTVSSIFTSSSFVFNLGIAFTTDSAVQVGSTVYFSSAQRVYSVNLATMVTQGITIISGFSAFVYQSAISAEGSNLRLTRFANTSTGTDGTYRIQTCLLSSSFSVIDAPYTIYSNTTKHYPRFSVCQSTDSTFSKIYFEYGNAVQGVTAFPGVLSTSSVTFNAARSKIASDAVLLNGQRYMLLSSIREKNSGVFGSLHPFRSVFLISDTAVLNNVSLIAALEKEQVFFGNETNQSKLPLYVSGTMLKVASIESEEITDGLLGKTSLHDYSFDFSFNNLSNSEFSNTLITCGSISKMYDGRNLVESGFLVAPYVTNTSTGVGSIPAGTYFYKAVYAWTDNQGQIHRSAASPPKQVDVVSSAHSIVVCVPYLYFTEKENVQIELYRTTASGTIFYKVTQDVVGTIINNKFDTTTGYCTYTDQALDSDIISKEILYTQSGSVDFSSPYPSTYVHEHKNRLFTIIKNGTGLQFSNESVTGEPPTWADEFLVDVGGVGGSITGLGSLESGLIIFKESAIYILSGNGPNALGENSDYGVPVLITTEAGCIDGTSIVEVPAGLIFKSSKGFYLLGRNLQVQDIGKGVEKWRPYSVTCSSIVPDKNEVRFGTSEGFLVYEYQLNKWTLDTGLSPISCVAIGSDFYYVDNAVAAYKVRKEIKGQFNDDGSQIPMLIKTAWISLAGLQSSERLYKLLILAHFKNRHRLNIAVLYDFSDSEGNSFQYDTNDVFNTPDLNDTKKYEFKFYPKRQKCTSFQLIITDGTASGGPIGENLVISNIAAEVGIKSGLNKLPVRKSGGGS